MVSLRSGQQPRSGCLTGHGAGSERLANFRVRIVPPEREGTARSVPPGRVTERADPGCGAGSRVGAAHDDVRRRA